MLVFISWSGTRSQLVAQALRTWLKDAMQILEPWVSSEDIRQGARWNLEVAQKLKTAHFGILCVTRDNLSAPWLLFEAGALAKSFGESRVCPYLIDVNLTEVDGPLAQFQAASANESGTLQLLHSLNVALPSGTLSDESINRAFTRWWPDLRHSLSKLPADSQSPAREHRTDRALLEELLLLVRRTQIESPKEFRPPTTDLSPALPFSLFSGPDIDRLLAGSPLTGQDSDPNARAWYVGLPDLPPGHVNGTWTTRWSGGNAGGDWVTGTANICTFGDHVYILTSDGRADCFIALQARGGGALAGRYMNLAVPREVLPWVGVVVDPTRIDGAWPYGRWDFRRNATRDG